MTSTMFRYADSRDVIEQGYARLLHETPQVRPQRVATRFGETHMLVGGREDAPPLVVLHGAMANSALAIREGHALLEHFRVYALDVLGQSVKSADVRLRVDSNDHGEWLLDVLDALKLPVAHFYGASMGGFIARRLAELAPTRIDRLVLLVPAGIISGPLLKGVTDAGIPLALYRALGSQAALKRFLDALLTNQDAALVDYLGQALKHYKLDFGLPPLGEPGPLEAFRRPTLVLAASDDLTAPGRALLARAAELFPHATLELMADCKHIPATDDVSRQKLCARVSSFLLD